MERYTDTSPHARLGNLVKLFVLFPAMHVVGIGYALQTYSPGALAVCLVLVVLTSLGVEVGFHRMLIHQAFQAHPWIRYGLALLGTLSAQDGPLSWAANHRRHHKYSDDPDNDPHTPVRSFLHGHVGWLHNNPGVLRSQSYLEKWCPDLLEEAPLRFMSKYYDPLLVLSAVVLYLLGGFPFLVWGFAQRTVITWHFEFSINSVCHRLGRQRWKTGDESRNVWWLAIPTLGESFHNNHHVAPRSARVGFEWWEIDLGWYFIWTLEKLGLAWDVVRPQEERVLAKAIAEPMVDEAP
jgi:stearoyl-CoA desaturase (delta-9 desaturase)